MVTGAKVGTQMVITPLMFPNSVKKELGKKWNLSKVYTTLSQLGEAGRVASMLLKTVDISSFFKSES